MWINFLKVAIRNIVRNKTYSIINILGLSIGLASCIVISLYVYNESIYDQFWTDSNQIYRVNTTWGSEGGEIKYATSPPTLANVMLNEVPEVEAVARLFKWGDFTLRPDTDSSNVFRETNVNLADQNYFRVFRNRLLAGNPESALTEPGSIVLSESAAIRYFGQEFYNQNEIVGRNILGGKDGGTLWHITAIMKDIPANSHQQFEILISSWDEFNDSEIWTWNIMHTYVLLNKNSNDKSSLNNISLKLDDIVEKHAMPYMGVEYEQYKREGNTMIYSLQPITDIHLRSNFLREMRPNGDIQYVYILSLIALFILLIACVNFTNLSTALGAQRAKEVGIRKSLGSFNTQLISQFLVESMLFSILAILIALGLVELFYLFLIDAFQLYFTVGLFDKWYFIAILTLMVLFVGLIAGIYPSFYLTAFRPVDVLKGKLSNNIKSGGLRNTLVIFQFTVSIGLIISTLVVNDQINYIRSKNLGYDRENVLIIQNDREIEERREDFKNVLKAHSEILEASFSTGIPALQSFKVRDYTVEGEERGDGFRWFEIDDTFLETMNMELVAGRNLSKDIASDSFSIILNQKAVARLGLSDPIGKFIIINIGANDERKVKIVGVVKDFNYESFYSEIRPLGMEYRRGYVFKDYISIRIAPGKTLEAVDIVKSEWSKFEPEVPLSYNFLDQSYENIFKAEFRLEKLFKLFTFLAIFIAALGLMGLAAYITEHRKKEIGIRKVLGASVTRLILMLTENFTRLALAGFLIAVPLAYYMMHQWLTNFVYKVNINTIIFLWAGLSAIGIALITVSYQAIKAALSNPVNALKEE